MSDEYHDKATSRLPLFKNNIVNKESQINIQLLSSLYVCQSASLAMNALGHYSTKEKRSRSVDKSENLILAGVRAPEERSTKRTRVLDRPDHQEPASRYRGDVLLYESPQLEEAAQPNRPGSSLHSGMSQHSQGFEDSLSTDEMSLVLASCDKITDDATSKEPSLSPPEEPILEDKICFGAVS